MRLAGQRLIGAGGSFWVESKVVGVKRQQTAPKVRSINACYASVRGLGVKAVKRLIGGVGSKVVGVKRQQNSAEGAKHKRLLRKR